MTGYRSPSRCQPLVCLPFPEVLSTGAPKRALNTIFAAKHLSVHPRRLYKSGCAAVVHLRTCSLPLFHQIRCIPQLTDEEAFYTFDVSGKLVDIRVRQTVDAP